MSFVNIDAFTEYVRIELDLGFTFATIAANTSDQEKFVRNREHVRRVCETARHFMHLVPEERRVKFCKKLDGLELSLRNLDTQG